MKVGNLNALSVRDRQATRERLAWEKEYAEKERRKEDEIEYQKYLQQLNPQRTAEGLKLQPLDFEAWRKLMPQDEPYPALRAAIATNAALQNQSWRTSQRVVREMSLSQEELQDLGFALHIRLHDGALYDDSRQKLENDEDILSGAVRNAFVNFLRRHPEYDTEHLYDVVVEFINRNSLYPTETNLEAALELLAQMGLIHKKPEPAPDPEPSPATEPEVTEPTETPDEARRRYMQEIVLTDERNGRGYTAYELDRISADEYKRLVFPENFIPTFSAIIKPGL